MEAKPLRRFGYTASGNVGERSALALPLNYGGANKWHKSPSTLLSLKISEIFGKTVNEIFMLEESDR